MMKQILKVASFFGGIYLLAFMSVQWSVDGFKIDFVSTAGMTQDQITVLMDKVTPIGFGLAVIMIILQFVFATALEELNWTLIGLGLISYVYSIGTNISGIAAMHGGDIGYKDWILGILLDLAPEPMIAWGLGQALVGDALGNLAKLSDGLHQGRRKGNPYQPSGRNNRNKRRDAKG